MHEDRRVRLTAEEMRRIRERLAAGEITLEQAREMGFPPADPEKENR